MELIKSYVEFLRRRREYRITRSSLHDLDDRLLADIGVRRDQIDTLARDLHKAELKRDAAAAQERKEEKARRNTMGGHGLAPQF